MSDADFDLLLSLAEGIDQNTSAGVQVDELVAAVPAHSPAQIPEGGVLVTSNTPLQASRNV